MTKDETQRAIEVMQAWIDGRTVEFRYQNEPWLSFGGAAPLWAWDTMEYRIKPDPRELWIDFYPSGRTQIYYESPSQAAGEVVHYREVLDND